LVSKIAPKVSKHAYQNLSNMHPKPLSLPNIHDHLHDQHFNICKSNLHDPNLSKSIQTLNMSINYFTQTRSPTPVTYKLPKKHYSPKNKPPKKHYSPKNKPLQHRSYTNHYISKNKKHVKKIKNKINASILAFSFSGLTP
jgi:hypothetical protein